MPLEKKLKLKTLRPQPVNEIEHNDQRTLRMVESKKPRKEQSHNPAKQPTVTTYSENHTVFSNERIS